MAGDKAAPGGDPAAPEEPAGGAPAPGGDPAAERARDRFREKNLKKGLTSVLLYDIMLTFR